MEKKVVAKELKWTDQLADELHRPVVKRFRKRIVVAHGIDNIWAADLVDIYAFPKFNNGVK